MTNHEKLTELCAILTRTIIENQKLNRLLDCGASFWDSVINPSTICKHCSSERTVMETFNDFNNEKRECQRNLAILQNQLIRKATELDFLEPENGTKPASK